VRSSPAPGRPRPLGHPRVGGPPAPRRRLPGPRAGRRWCGTQRRRAPRGRPCTQSGAPDRGCRSRPPCACGRRAHRAAPRCARRDPAAPPHRQLLWARHSWPPRARGSPATPPRCGSPAATPAGEGAPAPGAVSGGVAGGRARLRARSWPRCAHQPAHQQNRECAASGAGGAQGADAPCARVPPCRGASPAVAAARHGPTPAAGGPCRVRDTCGPPRRRLAAPDAPRSLRGARQRCAPTPLGLPPAPGRAGVSLRTLAGPAAASSRVPMPPSRPACPAPSARSAGAAHRGQQPLSTTSRAGRTGHSPAARRGGGAPNAPRLRPKRPRECPHLPRSGAVQSPGAPAALHPSGLHPQPGCRPGHRPRPGHGPPGPPDAAPSPGGSGRAGPWPGARQQRPPGAEEQGASGRAGLLSSRRARWSTPRRSAARRARHGGGGGRGGGHIGALATARGSRDGGRHRGLWCLMPSVRLGGTSRRGGLRQKHGGLSAPGAQRQQGVGAQARLASVSHRAPRAGSKHPSGHGKLSARGKGAHDPVRGLLSHPSDHLDGLAKDGMVRGTALHY
jgi:hypothetical protein